jgi:hypothetical protein
VIKFGGSGSNPPWGIAFANFFLKLLKEVYVYVFLRSSQFFKEFKEFKEIIKDLLLVYFLIYIKIDMLKA